MCSARFRDEAGLSVFRRGSVARKAPRLLRSSRGDWSNIMKLGLINSAWAQSGRETVWGIQKTRELGFDTIDIFADPLDLDVREKCRIKRECDRLGLPIASIACVPVGLVDFNPSVQRFSLERVKAYLDLAHEYEARNVLLLLGEYILNHEVI